MLSLAELQTQVGRASDLAAARRELLAAANALAWVGGRDGVPDRWAELGLEVRAAMLGENSGGRLRIDARDIIEVAICEPYVRQRFSVAHEVGHLLLDRSPVAASVGHRIIEGLCNEFAQALLTPPAEVRARVRHQPVTKAADVFGFARHFNVSVSVALAGLRQQRLPEHGVLVAAEWTGHPERQEVQHYRVWAWAGPGWIFVPPHARLITLGLTQLAAQAAEASHRDCLCGADESVRLAAGPDLRGRGVAAIAGPAEWDAVVMGERSHLLAHMKVNRVRLIGRRPDAQLSGYAVLV